MKIRLNILLILFCIIISVYADQQDNIINEIANYNLSGEQFLDRAQHLIIDYFEENNYSKVDSILNVLQKYYTEQQIFGNEKNRFLIYLWLEKYSELLDIVPSNPGYYYSHRGYRSNLGETTKIQLLLLEKTKSNLDLLIEKINDAELSEDKKKYLELVLDYFLYDSSDFFNERATSFLSKFPSSEFESKIRQLRTIYRITNTGAIFGLNLNYGVFSGNLKEYFDNHYGMNSYFDILNEHFSLHLNFDFDMCKIKKDINSSDVWAEGRKVSLMKYGIGVGYPLILKNKIRIVPNVGIAGMQFGSAKEDSDTKTISLYPAYTISLILDILLNRNENNYVVSDHCIRLRVHYQNPEWQNRGEMFAGSSLVFSVGYAWFANVREREY